MSLCGSGHLWEIMHAACIMPLLFGDGGCVPIPNLYLVIEVDIRRLLDSNFVPRGFGDGMLVSPPLTG